MNNKPNNEKIKQIINKEARRIAFIEDVYGIIKAIKFSRITKLGYRHAVLNKDCYASNKEYKYEFILSYLVFKIYLEKQEQKCQT